MKYSSNILHIDLETFSDINIDKGVRKYTSSSAFGVQLLAAKRRGNNTLYQVDYTQGEKPKGDLLDMMKDPSFIKVAHNAEFEIQCMEAAGVPIKGQWVCTMLMARAWGLPGSLDKLGHILSLKNFKLDGKKLVQFFGKPDGKGKINKPEEHPKKWSEYKKYNRGDVLCEDELFELFLENDVHELVEWDLWQLDREIGSRGILVDIPFCKMVCNLNDKDKEEKMNRAKEITGLENPNSLTKLKPWMADKLGQRELLCLDKDAVEEILSENRTPDDVREVLRIRQSIGSTSLAKYYRMICTVMENDRLYDNLGMYGGHTRRWRARGVQVHNFPKTHLNDDFIVDCKDAIMQGINPETDIEPGILKQLLRPALIAPKGKYLNVADFSAIEPRVLAKIADQKWMQEEFNGDGLIYEAMAAKMYVIDKSEVDSELRGKGKTATLSLGYRGGPAALIGKFDGTFQEKQALVRDYRRSVPNIVRFWRDLETAAINTIITGRDHQVGWVSFSFNSGVMYIKLPSDSVICYHKPTVNRGKIVYKGWKLGKWRDIELHGGILCENIVQSIARDILVESLVTLEQDGVKTIFHVHDEIIAEGDCTGLQKMIDVMERPVSWLPGVKIKATGYSSKFYKKE